jgi:PHS family inorganic phosphate transporter-like MFS transporter
VRRFHRRTLLISGMGFFTDAYDLFVIGLIVALFTFYQPFGIPGDLFTFPLGGRSVALTGLGLLGAAAIFGAAGGPFLFGRLGDLLGRKAIYGIEMLILVFGALGSALAWSFASLVLFRLVLGFGIGGDYPMSAPSMSEYSNGRHRGKLVGTVFAMQGFGLLSGVVLGLGLLSAFPHDLQFVWRALLAAGAIPAAAVYYYRRRLPETPRFTLQVKNDQRGAAQVVRELTGAPVQVPSAHGGRPARLREFLARYWPLLLGTSLSWFFFDISFYGTSIYTPTLLSALSLNVSPHLSAVGHLVVAEEYNAILTVLFTVPGYWIAVAAIDRVGRKTLQAVGFGVMTLCFAVLGLDPSLIALGAPFVLIYGLTFLFGNIGPNTTTFVVPTEVFPTAYRTTGHGISAGSGKIGASISTLLFATLVLLWSPSGMMLFLAVVALAGLVTTLVLLKETKQRSLEESSRPTERGMGYLAASSVGPRVFSK